MRHQFGGYTLDDERGELFESGTRTRVRPQVMHLLLFLIQNRHRPVSRREICAAIWSDTRVSSNSFTNLLFETRQSVGDDGRRQRVIRTLGHQGYRFVADVDSIAAPLASDGAVAAARSRAGDPTARADRTDPHALFVGREDAMSDLLARLDEARLGRPSLVLVSGEMGIGKSRLVEELEREAWNRGHRVYVGRCEDALEAPSYWPWVQIIRSFAEQCEDRDLAMLLGSGASEIAGLAPELRGRLASLDAAAQIDSGEGRFRLFDSVSQLVRRAALDAPLLLILEDLHSGDVSSLQLLRFLAGSLRDEAVVVVATFRDGEIRTSAPHAEHVNELRRLSATREVPLMGLDRSAVEAFLDASVESPRARSLVASIHALTGGNPFFLCQLRHMKIGPLGYEELGREPPETQGLPASLRDAVQGQLQRLPSEVAAVLTHAAVLGREFALRPLELACGRTRADVMRSIAVAIELGIVERNHRELGRYRFRHILVRDVLYGALREDDRARLHRSAGESLEEHYGAEVDRHLPELAHHFTQSATLDLDDRPVELTLRAAEQALAKTGYEEAIRHYQTALQLFQLLTPADEGRRCDVQLGLTRARALATGAGSATADARAAAQLARALADPVRLAHAALAPLTDYFGASALDADRAHVQLLEEALDALDDSQVPLRAQLLTQLGRILYRGSHPELHRKFVRLCSEIDPGHPDPRVRACVVANRYWSLHGPEHTDARLKIAGDVFEQSERIGDRSTALDFRLRRLAGQLVHGDFDTIDSAIDAYLREARELRSPQGELYSLALPTTLALVRGDYAEAARCIGALGELRGRCDTSNLREHIVTYQAQLWFERGELDQHVGLFAAAAEEFRDDPAWASAIPNAYCEAGDLDSARRSLEELVGDGLPRLLDRHTESWTMACAMLADTCAGLGDQKRAAILYERLLPLEHKYVVPDSVGTFWGPIARPLARLATTLERYDEAELHFERALEMSRRIPSPPWLARTQQSYAAMLLAGNASGDSDAARQHLASALDIALALGMKTVERRCRALEAV